MYLYTDNPYSDTAVSWGIGPREAHGIVSDAFPVRCGIALSRSSSLCSYGAHCPVGAASW